ncbi:polysaccharide deacetylase family protein [Halalkalicoccus subterraneus]|uniref:polysaccharide deacetylase family protein n=1 Tax=Halalkalicoccus subterraneus TaxID=2675002 RepID=UPI000EFC7398|nr:polysaccharide deacetylase family protein [Halalkalicoccus subterraneus]
MTEPSRRAFLATGAVIATGFAGCLGSSDQEDDPPENDTETDTDENETPPNEELEVREPLEPPEGGAVVFVYDDGPMEDYTQALPAHQAFDAPATVGIVSSWVGRDDYQNNGCMDVTHLEELVDAGWEIASHTIEHTPVGTLALVEDAEPSDERVYPKEIRHGYNRGKTVELTDGTQSIRRVVTDYGSDGVGRYIELDEPLGEACAAGDTVVRYPEEAIEEMFRGSKRELEAMGFEISTFLAPYDNFDDYSREFAPEYYDGIANADHGSRINDREEFDPFRTKRDYFIEFTDSDSVKADLDEIADRGALGILGAHTFKEEVSEERIGETLGWIDERGIEVLTLREAIELYANA